MNKKTLMQKIETSVETLMEMTATKTSNHTQKPAELKNKETSHLQPNYDQ